jgi:hypothetical protein
LIFIDLLSSVPNEQRATVLHDANILDPRQGTLL